MKPLSKQAKRYPIHQSPLFKIRGKGQLESVLGLSEASARKISIASNYRVFLNEAGREIQHPIGSLAALHKRIDVLMAKVEMPDYVYAQKGRSYFDNAAQHCGDIPLGKADISKFYPSTTRAMVRGMFRREFKCAADICDLLADICCYKQKHLPTGSTLSGRVAFFSAKPMFDEIERLALSVQCRMTVFVDDITLSGASVDIGLMLKVRDIVRRHGLKTKSSKTKTFPPSRPKIVTGTVVLRDDIVLPNIRHKKIADARRQFETATGDARSKIGAVLRGRLQEANMIRSANAHRKAL